MTKRKIFAWLSAVAVALSPLNTYALSTVYAQGQVRIQDDLYQAVNQEWIDQVQLEDYMPIYDNASDIQSQLGQTLFTDLEQMIEGVISPPNEALAQYVTFSRIARNIDQRNQQGANPIRPYFDKIDKIQSLEELQATFKEWSYLELELPFSFVVVPDINNSAQHIVALNEAALLSLDLSLYEDQASYDDHVKVYRDSKIQLLTLMGYSTEEATQTVDTVIESDKAIAAVTIPKEEMTNWDTLNNVRTAQEIKRYSQYIDLSRVANDVVGQPVDQFLVTNLAYFEKLNEWLNPNQLETIKARMRVSLAQQYAQYLTDDMRLANDIYNNKVTGVSESYDADFAAYLLALNTFSEPIGTYYGQHYFGEEARQDVESIAHNIIDTYKERLKQNDWLDKHTIEGALRKLDTMQVYIGYPDYEAVPYAKGVIDENATLFDTIVKMKYDEAPGFYGRINAPVEKGIWGMPAHEVNAYYAANENAIYFPAGFLQAPYYSKDYTLSQNYAGIGATIGHEITHAFDPSGSKFDEYGNLSDWWTDADKKKYEEKSQAMIEQWNALTYAGLNINGKLAITENVADAGGLRVALDALKKVAGNDVNMEEFFTNWAAGWREKGSDDYYRTLILTDEHPPSKLRANIQAMYLDEFHETYQTKEGDGMYLAPDKRLKLW